MKEYHIPLNRIFKAGIIILLSAVSLASNAQQKLKFGVHADPVISWFSTDIDAVSNLGSRPGFNFGLIVNKYFSKNYAFSTGINIISAAGKLVSDSVTVFESKGSDNALILTTVQPEEAIIYNIQYVSIPIGLKLQTNQIGYITIFTDIGVDPKVVVGGKANIPSMDITKLNANKELRLFNLSYHIIAGIEYGIGGNTAVVLGLGFDNNFLDITSENNYQPDDRVSHKLLSFRLGVNF
jgi:hypothetical protein